MKNKVLAFIKKEIVLTAAWLLAIISCFIVKPDREYLGYIDMRTLGILWSLMMVMQGLRKNGVFDRVSKSLLSKVSRVWQLSAILVGLCFFSSMLITNDVALITFVPFAVIILEGISRQDLIIPVLVLQTLAANLGSMLTPIGNPQNLYLYGLSGMSIAEFCMVMLPYTILSFVMVAAGLLFLPRRNESVASARAKESVNTMSKAQVSVYLLLFAVSLLTVFRIIPYYAAVAAVLILCLIIDRRLILSVDYTLLLTFVGFFIFTGNIHRVPELSNAVSSFLSGHEVLFGVGASQVISNVPAALLLADFTENLKGLLVGVNLGGLGTLIASMASLISYKAYAEVKGAKKGRYLLIFTLSNIVCLAVLLVMAFILGDM